VLGVYVVFPTQGDASVKVRTEERRRSLFKVPVFQADLKFDAAFDLAGVPSAAPADAVLEWTRAGIVVGVSDARGALADGTVAMNGKTITFVPAETVGDPNPAQRLPLTYFGVRGADIAQPNATFRATAVLRFSGAQRISVLAFGKTTHLTVEADWPSPNFDGGFLPVKRTLSAQVPVVFPPRAPTLQSAHLTARPWESHLSKWRTRTSLSTVRSITFCCLWGLCFSPTSYSK